MKIHISIADKSLFNLNTTIKQLKWSYKVMANTKTMATYAHLTMIAIALYCLFLRIIQMMWLPSKKATAAWYSDGICCFCCPFLLASRVRGLHLSFCALVSMRHDMGALECRCDCLGRARCSTASPVSAIAICGMCKSDRMRLPFPSINDKYTVLAVFG